MKILFITLSLSFSVSAAQNGATLSGVDNKGNACSITIWEKEDYLIVQNSYAKNIMKLEYQGGSDDLREFNLPDVPVFWGKTGTDYDEAQVVTINVLTSVDENSITRYTDFTIVDNTGLRIFHPFKRVCRYLK